MTKTNKITHYINGYCVRLLNRYSLVLEHPTGGWVVTFVKCWPGLLSVKQLTDFDSYYIRMGKTITTTHVRVSDEALKGIVHGFICHPELKPKEPVMQ